MEAEYEMTATYAYGKVLEQKSHLTPQQEEDARKKTEAWLQEQEYGLIHRALFGNTPPRPFSNEEICRMFALPARLHGQYEDRPRLWPTDGIADLFRRVNAVP